MEHIILDTSVFVKENFLHGKKINSLLNLSKNGKIKIYITEITFNEYKSNYKKFLLKSIANHNKFRKESENWVLRNDEALNVFFDKIDSEKLFSNFETQFDNLVNNDIIRIIPYKSIDIECIFDKYFKQESPFGKADKKSEFPDAFSIELVEQFCEENGIKAKVFSMDNDYLEYKSENFEVQKDYDSYLEFKYTELENIKNKITALLFVRNKQKIENEFINWYKSNLDDVGLYYSVVNYKEIYDIEVEEINVNELEYKIIEIDDDVVVIEVKAKTSVKVNVLTEDEEYMYYDSDDKSHHYLETNYETFEKEFESSMIMTTKIFDENDYYELEVENINEDKEIKF